jgi:radical SAM protein with 4Fe4S-binding SPASM domain
MPELEINWEITKGCNLRCIYCRPDAARALPNELTLSEVLTAIDHLSQLGYTHFKFTGGEPLYRPDFWQIAEHIKSNGADVSIITNALLINSDNIDRCIDTFRAIGVSIDSLDKKTNDALGRKRSEYSRSQIELLVNRGACVALLCTISAANRAHIGDILDFANNLGIKLIKFNDVSMEGRALQHSHKLQLQQPFITEFNSFSKVVRAHMQEEVELQESFKCECSSSNLFIDATGAVYPCVELAYADDPHRFALGNLRSDNVKHMFAINRRFYSKIQPQDTCAYSYASSPSVSLCLNNRRCPATLSGYMSEAKLYAIQRQ